MQSIINTRNPKPVINSNSAKDYKNGKIYQDEESRILQSKNAQEGIENDLSKNVPSRIIDDEVKKLQPKSKLNEMTGNQKSQALNSDKIAPTSSQSVEKEELSGDKTLDELSSENKELSAEQKKQAEALMDKKYKMSEKSKAIEDAKKSKEQKKSDEKTEEEEEKSRNKTIERERGIVKNSQKQLNESTKNNLSNEARSIDDIEGQKSDQEENPDKYNAANKLDTAFNVHNDAEYEKLALEHLMKLKKIRLKSDPSQDSPIHIDDKTMEDFFAAQELKSANIEDDAKNIKQKGKKELSMSAIDHILKNIPSDSKSLKYDNLDELNKLAEENIKDNLEKFKDVLEGVKNPIDGLSEKRRKEISDHIKSKISFIENCNQGDSLVRFGKILKEKALFGEYEESVQKEIDKSQGISFTGNLKGDDISEEKNTFANKEKQKKKAQQDAVGR